MVCLGFSFFFFFGLVWFGIGWGGGGGGVKKQMVVSGVLGFGFGAVG